MLQLNLHLNRASYYKNIPIKRPSVIKYNLNIRSLNIDAKSNLTVKSQDLKKSLNFRQQMCSEWG